MSALNPRVVCLGQFTVDNVYLPDGTCTPECTGGDAFYAALGARLWEPTVQIVAPVGNDLPERTLQEVRAAGFSTDGLPRRPARTIRNNIYYDVQGGRRWEELSPSESFEILSPMPDDIPAHYRDAEAFLISAMALEAQEILVSWLRQHTNAVIALDPQEDYIRGNEERLRRLISRVDLFLPSEAEVVQLVDDGEWLAAAQSFAAMGPQVVVIKRGAQGALIYDGKTGSGFDQRAMPLEVIDTTGAGDAFCGGFLAGYVQHRSNVYVAARTGSISASYAVASFGMNALLAAKPEKAQARLTESRRSSEW